MIQRSIQCLANGMPTPEALRGALREHDGNCARLRTLGDAYRGRAAIANRTRSPGLPNNRVAHPFARYIVAVTTGYLIGRPATYACPCPETTAPNTGRSGDAGPSRPGGVHPTLQAILENYRRGSIAAVDVENARNAAIYGRGVEYVHVDGAGNPHAAALSPLDAFVVYGDDCDLRPLFGVYRIPSRRADGSLDGWRLWVMNDARTVEYRAADPSGGGLTEVASEPHYFGGVPIVEYWNDEDERGDFEWVLPLIDAYDALQSDRINDKEQFVNALLVLTGCTLETDERGREPWRQLREDKALCLPDSQAKAEYLARQMNEADVEVLRRALAGDIHKLSMVPDLSDESFAANASGVAMRYKLWGLEQLVNAKQRWFIEGLRERLKLMANYMELRGFPRLDVAGVEIGLTRAMPANLLEQAQIAKLARESEAASAETRVRLLHGDGEWTEQEVSAEAKRIQEETNAQT